MSQIENSDSRPPAAPQVSDDFLSAFAENLASDQRSLDAGERAAMESALNETIAASVVAPSPQPEQTATIRFDFINADGRPDSKVITHDEMRSRYADKYQQSLLWMAQPEQTCTHEWKRLMDDGKCVMTMCAKCRATAPPPAPLSLPAEYASAHTIVQQLGYAWVQTDHGMQWYRKELSDRQIVVAILSVKATAYKSARDYEIALARAVLAADKGEQQ